MEVSSQGLKLHRSDGILFDVGVFTNLGRDHIGPKEHKDMAEYAHYKSLLFQKCCFGIGNIDDPIIGKYLKMPHVRFVPIAVGKKRRFRLQI